MARSGDRPQHPALPAFQRFFFREFGQVEFNRHQFGEEHAATVGDVILVGAVVNLFPLAPALDQVGLFEKMEMVGDGWLGHVETLDQIGHTLLPVGLQNLQDSLARFVAQGFTKGDHIQLGHYHLSLKHIDNRKYVDMIAVFRAVVKGQNLNLGRLTLFRDEIEQI